MTSDVIYITNNGKGYPEALHQAEAVAAFFALPKKAGLHLRLLTEEMMGMMRALTGEREGRFWISSEDGAILLHLKVNTVMNAEIRQNLLSASTSGKNAAAKGVMGKIRDLVERMLEPANAYYPEAYAAGWDMPGADPGALGAAAVTRVSPVWSLNRYRSADRMPQEDWDELEKSVIANLADEVKIAIADGTVEMTVYKTF